MPFLEYRPPPTLRRFMLDESFGRIVAGPVGSGKTICSITELFRRACAQEPASDGLRYTRFAIVRQTLKQLKDTIVKDCRDWLQGLGEYKVSESAFHLNFGDVRSEWMFIPLEDAGDQARLLSSQLTAAWGSEVIEMNFDILAPLTGRIGRYPNGAQGVPTWKGIIADTNMPMELTDWHKFFVRIQADLVPNWQLFIQPSGLSPEAENLPHLNQTAETRMLPENDPKRVAQGRLYYSNMVDTYGVESPWVRRYVKAEYGPDPGGLVVFRETFRPTFHCADETHIIPGYPILIGQDFGRDPWSIICQSDHMGRLIVHEEVAATNVGLEKHIIQSLRPRLMQEKYLGRTIMVVGDPAGVAKGQVTEETCFDCLKRMGLPAFPAVTNDIDPRIRAVEALLQRHIDEKPALLINKRQCPTLVVGLGQGYKYTKTREGQSKSAPDKNEYSHVVDALQYACLVVHGGLVTEMERRARPWRGQKRPAMPVGAWT